MFFKKTKVYRLAGTMEEARRHISNVAKSQSDVAVELEIYPDVLSVYPNPLPSYPNLGQKLYYPYFQGKLLETTDGVMLTGAVSIGGWRFQIFRILMVIILINFFYLTANAITEGYFFWAIVFLLFGGAIIWIFMQFCIPSASAYKEKTETIEAFFKALNPS